jgi:hypothetical protein
MPMKRTDVLALVRTLEGVNADDNSQPNPEAKCMSKAEAIEALLVMRKLAGLPATHGNSRDPS